MSEPSTPRQMVKALLQGTAPSRPLLMPIIFSLGARLQTVTLPQFLVNPTKIVNALRQIRSVLKIDGLTCYFDPFLEAVALGCKREWNADGSCAIGAPSFTSVDELRERLKPADGLPGEGNIAVACEVLRRLKAILRDEPALMVCVTGPLSLAAKLSGAPTESPTTPPPRGLVEFAAEVTASVSKGFLEAGADVILLTEDFLADAPSEICGWYGPLLTPVANMIRFYQALPLVSWNTTPVESLATLLDLNRKWALCPVLAPAMLASDSISHLKQNWIAAALPEEVFVGDLGSLRVLSSGLPNIGLLTSTSDLSDTVDIKHLSGGLDAIRSNLQHPNHETLAQPG